MKVLVAGLGYVGLANAVLLTHRGLEVRGLEADSRRAVMACSGECYLRDPELEEMMVPIVTYLPDQEMEALEWAEVVVVALPTSWSTDSFDTTSLEVLVHRAAAADCAVVIRSTVPVGTTERLRAETGGEVSFVPEFLREGRAWADSVDPSRVVSGGAPEWFAEALAGESGCAVLRVEPTEAELIKLASNAYLATRVAFFNELDSFCRAAGGDVAAVLGGVELDPRIGSGYNNPSIGYGGYCLPKDTRQLASQFNSVLLRAAAQSNEARIRWIAGEAVRMAGENGVVGVWRLDAKAGSDNERESASARLVDALAEMGCAVKVWRGEGSGAEMADCGVVVANRGDEVLDALVEQYGARVWVVGVHRWG